MKTAKVGRNGTVVIPAELRRRFGLEAGVAIVAEASRDGVLVRPAEAVESVEDRRRRLFEETNRAYAAIRADPDAWQEELAERALWDATLLDGLDPDERWTDEGGIVTPTTDTTDASGPR